MKKILALVMALMMALTCISAFADTVYTKLTIDRDIAKEMLPSMGVPEEQLGMIDSILAVVNALGVTVTTADGATQVDLDLNGTQAAALAWGAGDDGLCVVSTLIPSYYLTLSYETIGSIFEQFASFMPGGGDADSGADTSGLAEVFVGYFSRYIEAVSAAATPGEPQQVEYEVDDYTFDTMVPITVDIPAAVAATDQLIDEMLADEAVVSAIQASMASSGKTFDPEEIKSAFEEMKAHMPEAATAEFYLISDDPSVFFISGDAFLEGKDEASYHYEMLNRGENDGVIIYWDYESDMNIGLEYGQGTLRLDFTMGELYVAFAFAGEDDGFSCGLYFMDPDAPLVRLDVATAPGGELTLALDDAGKTVLALEQLMSDQEAGAGLMTDFQNNGLGALLGVAFQEVPEVAALLGMAG